MNNKVSIIIPAYNIANELPACLDSVLSQCYKNIEIIVVNDGSKDCTATVIDRYASLDSRVKAIHKKNGGVTSARLRGIQEASGDWIGFVDGDDKIEPDMYARLLENALKYHADISHCGYQLHFPGRVDYYYNTGRVTQQDHDTALHDLISGTFVEPGIWNKLYRRTLFDRLLSENLMDPSIRILEDILMNFYLFREAKNAVHEDFCPYHYILRPGSASTSSLNEHQLLDPLRVFRILERSVGASSALLDPIHVRIFQILIRHSTMFAKGNKSLIQPNRKSARKELRAMLPTMRNCPCCGKTLYLKGVWAAYLPSTYQGVLWLYRKITRFDSKHKIQ